MRCHQHVRQMPVGMLGGQGFDAEHIQRRLRNLPGLQRRDQRVIVDQRPAPRIDHGHPASHRRDARRVQHVLGIRRQGQQQNHDLGLRQNMRKPVVARETGHPIVLLEVAAPAQRPEPVRRHALCTGHTQRAQPQKPDRPRPRQRQRIACVPVPRWAAGVKIGVQVMPQHIAQNVILHALGQPRIDHARQRLGQGLVGHDRLDACPCALHQLGVDEGRQVGNRSAGRIDDVIDRFRRRGLTRQLYLQPSPRETVAQVRLPRVPVRCRTSPEDTDRHLSAACGHGRSAPARNRPAEPSSPSRRS